MVARRIFEGGHPRISDDGTPFCAASSPSCCNFALKQTARDTERTSGPLVAETIRRNFYVEDCLRSVEDEQTAIELTRGLSEACTHGGTCRPLTVQNLVNAELAILKFVQTSAFSEEIHALKEIANKNNSHKEKLQKQKKASIKSNSCNNRLDPFIDNGILRVGGGLKFADLPHETKHSAILPQKSHVTTLLIRHAHKRLGHSGRGHFISSLREKYSIDKVNTAVHHVTSKCVFCRRNYSRPNEQNMAYLPKNLHRCRLLRTLHHQGRTQGSKTIRRSIYVFSQSSSPYSGGKFS